jgi:hypothetical protein
MLKRVQTKRHKVCSVCDTNHSKYTTFFAQFVIVKWVGGGHDFARHVRGLRIRRFALCPLY